MQNRGFTLLWRRLAGADVAPAANNGNGNRAGPRRQRTPMASPVTGPVIFRFWNEPAGTKTIALTSTPPGAFTNNVYSRFTLDTNAGATRDTQHETPNGVDGTITQDPEHDWAWADSVLLRSGTSGSDHACA